MAGKEVRLFRSDEPLTRSEEIELIRQLAGKLDAGKHDPGQLMFQQGQQGINLDFPHNMIIVEIKIEDRASYLR